MSLLVAVALLAVVAVLTPAGIQSANAQSNMWEQLGIDIDGEAADDGSGRSVAMSSDGNTVIIGAQDNDGNGTSAGHARIYDWDGAGWIQRGADIDGEAAGDRSGLSVAMSSNGNTVIIGAQDNDGNGTSAGHARTYDWDGAGWVQRGADIDGEAAGDGFGLSVAMSSNGETVAIGAPTNDGNGANAGHARIYDWDGAGWIQRGAEINGEAGADQAGFSVAMSSNGNTVIIGANSNDGNGAFAGHARIFGWDGAAWVQRGADIDGEAAFDRSGRSVAISSNGNTVIIGAQNNAGSSSFSGHARTYDWDGAGWIQRGADIDGEAAFDQAGWSVAMSSDGNTVIIGAIANDGNGTNAGHARIYRFSTPALCQPGSFSATGTEPCTPAPAGTFVNTEGATSPTPCAVGTFQPASGATACDLAPAGTFVNTEGATSTTPCAVGTFQPASGATACDLAPAGTFVNTEGATEATSCPLGETTAGPGSVSADDCFPIDTDGDGVADINDICADTVLPDQPTRGLKKNRYAASIDGFASTDGIVIATLSDTGGCSGGQIIAETGLGRGHTKFGISAGALQAWIQTHNP